MDDRDRGVGSMIASAAGDALGAPVEFKAIEWIREEYGESGIKEFHPAYGRLGAITDDTQMALATARGLLKAKYESRDAIACVREEYLGWLETQNDPMEVRGPGNTCMAGLEEQKQAAVDRVSNDSKGCGGVMRVHPVGLYLPGNPEEAFELGARTSGLTHGHETSAVSTGAQAALVSLLAVGKEPASAVQDVLAMLADRDTNRETIDALGQAVNLAVMESSDSTSAIKSLGEGWIAEEALAIGVYCFLHFGNDPFEALVVSVNHSGDSDSTGAICGALLGTAFGVGWLPESWLDALEHREELEKLGSGLSRSD